MAAPPPVRLIVVLCAAFVATGSGVASVGPSLQGLAQDVGRPLSDLGTLLSALFTGMLLSQAVSGGVVDRYGVRPASLTSFALYAAGAMSLPFAPSLRWLLASGLVMGLGFGMSSIALNSLAATLMPVRPGFVLNLINVWYAVGTVAGPFLASLWLDRGGRAADVLVLAGLSLLLLTPAAWMLVPGRDTLPRTVAPRAATPAAGRWRPSPALLLIGLVVLLYGGIEAGFGGWVASYVQQTIGASASRAALLTSLFWLSYLVGRIAATIVTLTVRPGYVLAATSAVALVGGVVLGVAHGHATPTVVAIVLLGFGVGPVYPAMFALVTSRFRERPATAVSVTASIGSLGAVVLPWVMGRALPLADGRIVSWMPAAFAAGMLCALWLSQLLYRRERSAAGTHS